MKTRIVKFSYGTVKDASLKVPAEDFSIMHVVELIRESYFDYAFSANVIASDECYTSSIGQANFFAGALGGYETRLAADVFAKVKEMLESPISQALAVARRREPAGTPLNQLYRRASENEALSEEDRKVCAHLAKHLSI